MPAQHSITEPAPGRSGFDTGQTLRRQKAPMTAINEFRVRPVTRFNLTHYQEGERTGSVRSLGEFDAVEQAEEVGQALNCLVPGSTFTTLHGRTAGDYPIGLLASAIKRDSMPPGHVAVSLADVESFFLEWEQSYRDGATMTTVEHLKLTPEETAARNAASFWQKFGHGATQYVIVAIKTYEIDNKAYFADSMADAEKVKADAEATHGTEFAIFSR